MPNPLRAITVCVDYSDILSITVPYNRHHFSQMMIVTSTKDVATFNAVTKMCFKGYELSIYRTNAFYERGAIFNKWAALEEGLDVFGRNGWICLLDADVLWPKDLKGALDNCQIGRLYTPRRRMYPSIPNSIPREEEWKRSPLHHNDGEFAGYSQIFHADDPILGTTPWHDINWKHAGGADSFFQQKWSQDKKIRPSFECLHLGEAGSNWMGRVTNYADGRVPDNAIQKKRELAEMFRLRRTRTGRNRFDGEKIG